MENIDNPYDKKYFKYDPKTNNYTCPEGKEKYKKRMWMTEPPFGHFKKNLGFRQFLLRGIGKVKGEFTLLCIGYNIPKIHKKMMLQVS